MPRGDQLFRQWSILQTLAARRVSRAELSQTFDVCRRTIARDITALSMFPIREEHDGSEVYYELLKGAKLPQVELLPEQVAALLIAKSTILEALEGSPYREQVVRTISQLESLQRDASGRRQRAEPPVFFSSFDKPTAPPKLQARLIDAAVRRKLVYMRYYTVEHNCEQDRTVEPFLVHLHPNGVHLIAYCRHREAFLYFDLGCIRSLTVLEVGFDPAARGFDLKAFLDTTFAGRRGLPVIDVHLRIRNPTALSARHQFFHRSQTITEFPGGIELRFRAGAPAAVAARVLSLGPDCEVLEPASLRDAVAKKACEISMLYIKS